MSNDNLLVTFLNKIQDNKFLRTKKGLFFVLVSAYFIVSYKIRPFTVELYNNSLPFIISLIYFLFWFYFSGRLFFSSKIKILFAIDCSEEATRYFNDIEKTIHSKIDDLNISRAIKIIKMPSDFIISDRNAAEKYVRRRMVDLLIWGYTLDGRLQDNQVSEFRLKFTYLYRILPDPIKAIFIKQIDSSLRGRYWRILDENSFVDIQVVSTNIIEVSLFIIGLCLYIRGELEKSLVIFEKLKSSLEAKNENDFPDLANVKKQVDSYLVEGYNFIGSQLREIKPIESRKYFEKTLVIRPDDSAAHLNMAKLCYVLDNDLNAARNHTDKVINPDLKPLSNYNYAFFAVKEKEPKKVLRFYQRIRPYPSENIVDILSFLQNEFTKDQENILYHFALGYLNIYHGDIKIGIEELERFAEKAKNISEYDDLVKNSESILNSRRK